MNKAKEYFELAKLHASETSTDLSTQVGAVIVGQDQRIISVASNQHTHGLDVKDSEMHRRPEKYQYTEHAERNAIYMAAKAGLSTEHATMYLPWFPCADCARAIVQSGIYRLVCVEPDTSDQKWGADFTAALKILTAAKVIVEYVDVSD